MLLRDLRALRGLRATCAGAGLLALVAVSLAAQAPSGQLFRTGVDLVTVDVVVLDSKGDPVRGLTRADFTVLEDGRVQEVTDFQSVEVAPPALAASPGAAGAQAAPQRRAVISTNAGRTIAPGRAFAVVFDDMNLTRQQADESRKALSAFLDTVVSPDDSVSLVNTSGDTWLNARMPQDRERFLTALSRIQGKFVPDTSPEWMSDYEAMRIHMYDDYVVEDRVRRRYEYNRVAGLEPVRPMDQNDAPRIKERGGNVGIIAPYIQSRAEAVYSLAVQRNRSALALLARAADSLRLARGRKAVILLSKGFIYDVDVRGFKDVSRVARESNVAIYFIDARGLQPLADQFSAASIGPTDPRDIGWAQAGIDLEAAGAASVAEDSGGFAVRNTNDLSAGMRRIAQESRLYYLVGYVSRNNSRDGKFRKIQVRVTGKGLTVRARRGYYAPDEKDPGAQRVGLDPDVQRALDAPRDLSDIPVRATALVFDEKTAGVASVMVTAEADIRRFAFEPQNDRLTNVLELAIAATHAETGAITRFGQTIEMSLRRETLDTFEGGWYPVSREFQLAPGPYQARVVVRDRNSGRVGSVTHDFEVPPLGGFRVSTPILSDSVQADGAVQSAKPVLVARRTFASGSTLFCQFAAYGAATDPATRQVHVSSSWQLVRGDSSVVRETGPRTVTPAGDGTLMRLYGISLAGLPPGDYDLIVDVRDELAVKHVQLREPFTVVPGVGILPPPPSR